MGVIVKNPDILGGTPVFRGTRVPIQTLFDYLEGGETLEDFLEGFPTVSRESAVAAQGIEYQQNLTARKLAILILHTKSNRLKDLLPLIPACIARIESIQPGQIVRIDG
jgi:uncharacterized protein (DUF433 family)